MDKIILVLCVIFTLAKGHEHSVNTPVIRYDNYNKLSRLQLAKVLEDYDTKLEYFKEHYLGCLEGISVQLDMVTANVVQIEERLNPLVILSDVGKQCVTKYRENIPTVLYIETALTHCIVDANNQVTSLLSDAISVRNTLENYLKENYAKEIQNCSEHAKTKQNYTSCIISVTTNTHAYAVTNQKLFDNNMDAAECTAKAYIKRALDCSYIIQRNTISLLAETNIQITNCFKGKDKCKPCNEDYVCPNILDVHVDKEKQTMLNPFYNPQDHKGCLMLKVF